MEEVEGARVTELKADQPEILDKGISYRGGSEAFAERGEGGFAGAVGVRSQGFSCAQTNQDS